jgi:hypothetical protein
MNIRLTGASDLVDAWAAELQRAYGVTVALYPSRSCGSEVRAYCDLDDRSAAEIVGLPYQPVGPVRRRQAELATSTHEPGRRQLFITDETKLTEAEAEGVICAAGECEVDFIVPWASVIFEVEGGWQCFESPVDAATWRRARQESPSIPLAAPAALRDAHQTREASLEEPTPAGPGPAAGAGSQ